AGRHEGARNHDRRRNGAVVRIQPARNTARLSVEYAASVAPRIKRAPPIVDASQSRFGSINVDASVSEENSTINASRNDSPAGAARSSPALAATETSDAVKPTIRACRPPGISSIAPSQGAPIAMAVISGPMGVIRPFVIIRLPVRRGSASKSTRLAAVLRVQ